MVNKRTTKKKFIPLSHSGGWDFFVLLSIVLSAAVTLCISSMSAQVNPVSVGTLPALISEASGLQCIAPNLCYTFNDSDDDSRLYRIAENGQFLSQLVIQGVPHIDYEDIAYAQDGRLFIGDFGNNENDRQDLSIYILTDYSGSVAIPEFIDFSFEDQSEFPPEDDALNFDIEAMIHWQDSLFLFSRNRTSPYNGLTKIYSLPDEPGTHVATLRGELFGNLSETHNSVTAADISPSGSRIAWLTRGSIFLFTSPMESLADEVPAYNFFTTSHDFEGVSFIDECTILLVEEGSAAEVFSLNTCDIVTGLGIQHKEDKIQILQQYGFLSIRSEYEIGSLEIFDYLGRKVNSTINQNSIGIQSLSPGTYIILIEVQGKLFPKRFLVAEH